MKIKYLSLFIIVIFTTQVHATNPVLKWDNAQGDVLGYTIYYGLSSGQYPFSENVGNVTQYALNNFSLNEGTTYYFVIRAYNAIGESGNSNLAIYTVPDAGDTTPPLPPEGITGEIINESIVLKWSRNNETDITGYRVYYGTSSRNYGLPIPLNETQCSISGLISGRLYYFAVSAFDTSDNESGYSSPEFSITTPATIEASPSQTKYDNVNNFVNRFYVEVLNRQGETSGLEYWTNSLLSNERAGSDVAREFIFSQEFTNRGVSNSQFLTILYNAFFNREPDAGGSTFWLNKMDKGSSKSEILNGFLYSSEFGNLCSDYGIIPVK